MDIDNPTAAAEQAENQPPVADDEQAVWEIEKADLERSHFNLNREATDLRERVEDLSRQNGQLLSELGRYGTDIKEHINRQRQLEQARNQLTDKNLELETIIARINIEKEERDAAVVNATKEAQAALVESFALKDQLRQVSSEKVALAHSLEAVEQERRSIEFERQKYVTERDLHAESKKWLMNEVTERDNKVSSLRLELANKDMAGANERLQYQSQINFLNSQIESLKEKVEMLQFNNTDLLKRIEHTELSKSTELSNMEEEIRCQKELQRVLKESLEETKEAADSFKTQLDSKNNVLAEVRKVLREHQEEMDRERLSHADALREREEELSQTRIELAKVNEMIKNMSDVKLNVSEEELSELAPAAAETVRFLKGGQSLSSLVLEHARVCGKLAETAEENTNLRTTLEDLLETIDQNKPQLLNQRIVADELFDKSKRLENQLDEAEVERRGLVAQRDNAQRDLAYVRAELEKYQRDYEFVNKRNVELMYAVERQSKMHDPNWSEQADEQLFLSCAQLQRRNVELESDIENAKTSAAQAAMNAQSEEMAQLKADLAVTKKSEAELKTKVEQTKAAFESLKQRTEHFKELVRDSVSASEAKIARVRAEEAIAAKVTADATIERLRQQAVDAKADREIREKEIQQKLQSTESDIKSVTETNIKLNAMLEAQKTNAAVMEKEYKAALKDKESAVEELQKVFASDSEKEKKLIELGRQALEATDQAGTLRVTVRALEDELQIARTQANSLKMNYDAQKSILEKEEQVRQSVVEMANFLKQVQDANVNNLNNQLEVIKHERDSFKASSTRLHDQLTHVRNETKLTQQRLEKELDIVRSRLQEKEEQLSIEEMELVDLRSKLSLVQGQFNTSDTAGMTPDRLKREYAQLKNRTQFLENELDNAKRKLMEADAAQKRMDAEHAISATHNNVLEENLKQAEHMGSMERERLLASLKVFEDRAQQVTDQLAQNQVEMNTLRMEYDEYILKTQSETSELQRQLQVSALNLDSVKKELEVANATLLTTLSENSRNAATVEEHNTVVYQLQQKIDELENTRLRIQAELDNKTMDLLAESTMKSESDELREHAERQYNQYREKFELAERHYQQRNSEYEAQIRTLTQQYESISSRYTGNSLSSTDNSADETSQSNVVQSLEKLLSFVRQTKDEAIQRAMNAEIEMQRLRAETAEFENGKNDLIKKIRDLEAEKVATMASLVDRAQLIEQVESLTSVHTINAQLNDEKMKMQAQLSQLQKEKSDLERQSSILSAKNSEQNLKIAASNQEAVQRKKEIEVLKQKVESSTKGTSAALQTQVDQLKTQLTAARQEATTASRHAQVAEQAKMKAEESVKNITSKLNQTRQLAIKYRDENTELKKASETSAGGGDPCAGRIAALTKTHNEQVAQLNAENAEQTKQLNAKIEELNKEAETNSVRSLLLEKRLKQTSEQNAELKEQNDKLNESYRQLSQSRSVSATDVESKSSPAPSAKPVVRQTPTKTVDPSTAPMQQVEPDQVTASRPVPIRPLFGQQYGSQTSSSNVVPPAPAPSNLQQKASPEKRLITPSIPNELMDIIPPVPSDNIPDPSPSVNTFGSILPVFQTTVRVPTQSLFSSSSTTTVQPMSEKKSLLPNIDSAPSTPGSNVTVSQATSTLAPIQRPITTSTGDSLALPEESVNEGAADQSSLVSGSFDQKAPDADIAANDGESRDSTIVGGVSSSDGRRKRAANDFETNDAKRLRESPNEAVTSSESRPQINLAEVPELDDDDGVLVLENEVSDEDPNDNTIQDQNEDVIDLENDEEVLEDEMEGDEEDDDSFGNDEDFEDRKVEDVGDDEIVVLSDDDEPEGEADDDEESLNDVDDNDDDIEEIEIIEASNNRDIEEVLGGEDSQPSLDDQDREAASAVEEAEDEGRDPLGAIDEPSAPADPTGAAGIGNSGRVGPEASRVRLPTGLREAEREDQCSSSNETNEERPADRLSGRNVRNMQRPMRGGKPTRGVYLPGRGRGRGGGAP